MNTSMVIYPERLTSNHPRDQFRQGFIVGGGDLFKTRLEPAIAQHPFERLGVASLEENPPLAGLKFEYYRVPETGLLDLDRLDSHGFLKNTLFYIATPPNMHIVGLNQLAGVVPVAIEKPLCDTFSDADFIRSLVSREWIYPVDHKLFGRRALSAIDTVRRNPVLLTKARRISGEFFEEAGFVHKRHIIDCIKDTQIHLLALIVALIKPAGRTFTINVDQVQTATHLADPAGRFQTPTKETPTASRISGWICQPGKPEIRFELKQAKGCPTDNKVLDIFGDNKRLIGRIDLNEGGWELHARVLAELRRPRIDMRQTLLDAIQLTKLVCMCASLAKNEPPYPFGTWPTFLNAPKRTPLLSLAGVRY